MIVAIKSAIGNGIDLSMGILIGNILPLFYTLILKGDRK
jgi:hypothetical protein